MTAPLQPPPAALRDLFAAMRPSQWTKNAVVLAVFFFAFFDHTQSVPLRGGLARIVPATLLFCLVSSAVYLLNDVLDAPQDRRHPTKRFRPVAAGRLASGLAAGAGLALLAAGLGGSVLLSLPFAVVAAAYVAVQAAYTLVLKRVALVDVFVIASGFVLRALAGAAVLHVNVSVWLLLSTFLLALFLGLCKRRHEKALLVGEAPAARHSLRDYDEKLLDQLIAVTAAATIVIYAIYTMSPDTIRKFGTDRLGLTLPFVIFGVFRYLDLVYRHEQGDRPDRILLTDPPILVNLALYVLAALCILSWP